MTPTTTLSPLHATPSPPHPSPLPPPIQLDAQLAEAEAMISQINAKRAALNA